jgi:hypothetical protein
MTHSHRVAAVSAALVIFGGSAAMAKPNAVHNAPAHHAVAHQASAHHVSHPSVEAGLRYLQQAEASLASGYHDYSDFGGHRQKAQDLTQQAIAETQKALAFSNH